MLTELVSRRAPRSSESPAMVRYRLSKRLNALVDHADYLDRVGADTESTKADIRRTLQAMAMLDALAATNEHTGD
jgi:hypothetical protein